MRKSGVVVPLVKDSSSINFLNPKFNINGIELVFSTAELASISIDILGKKVYSLDKKREEIIGALDFLITGF